MFGRILSFLIAGALAALAVLIYDPALYGPGAPAIGFGPLEVFRPAILLAVALFALAAFFATVQPRPRSKPVSPAPKEDRTPHFTPFVLPDEAPPAEPIATVAAAEPGAEAGMDAEPDPEKRSPFDAPLGSFSFAGSSRPSPLW